MTTKDFNKLLEARLKKTREVLGAKALEYASADRLHNFKRAAEVLRTTPEHALLGMLTKHLVSVTDMVFAQSTDAAKWDEKLGDAVNYLILLEALVQERHDNS